MNKKIFILIASVLLLICSNLLGDDVFVTIWNATGHEMHDCGIYINSTQVLVNCVWEPGFTDYTFPVTNPNHAIVWAYGYADYYGYDFYASGQNSVFWNPNTNRWETCVEVTGGPEEVIFNITVHNPIDDAYNCSLVRNPGQDQEILFENGTIPIGTTTYTEYEILVGDEILIEGDVDGFYPGQVYGVRDLEVTEYEYTYPTLEIFVDLLLEYDAIPDYELRTTNLSSEGWNWVSFPVMDPDYNDPIQNVLAPILGDLEEVRHNIPFEGLKSIYWDGYNWQNDIGDFRSIDGYKIKMNNNADLEVAGWLEDPTTEVPLYEDEDNWIGYFLPETQDCDDAFGEDWDKVISIKSENWYYHIPFVDTTKGDPGTSVPIPSCKIRPLECGEGYIVEVNQDILDFTWINSGNTKEPYEKAESDYFTFEAAADYMPIFVDSSEVTEGVNEFGVFIDDECIGASKVEEYPVLILAYVKDDTIRYGGGELTFQLYNGTKNVATQVNGVAVYDPVTFAFEDRPVYLNKDEFVVVRLNTEEVPEIHVEFSLYQNYPNPIRTSTNISFSTPEHTDNTEIIIYNVKGQLVKTLLPTTTHQSALTSVYWNGTDENGNQLSNGIYFYKLTSGEKTAFKKMILLR